MTAEGKKKVGEAAKAPTKGDDSPTIRSVVLEAVKGKLSISQTQVLALVKISGYKVPEAEKIVRTIQTARSTIAKVRQALKLLNGEV